MPPSREWRHRIEDILDAIDAIHRYVEGMDFERFAMDEKTRDAVVMRLGVIGEAARHVPPEIQESSAEIEWTEMIANRNVMIHVYFGLKPEILWDTIQKDLPPLRGQLVALLAFPE